MTPDNSIIDFYRKFVRITFGNAKREEELKNAFFAQYLPENTLYKYISFTANSEMNSKKMYALRENLFWFSAHYVLRNNDPTEFQIYANTFEVARKTPFSRAKVKEFIDTLRESNDLCCLSDRLHEYMWTNYANYHSGCCCVFEIADTEMLWPVIYCDKSKTDFTQQLIHFMRNPNKDSPALRTLAFVCPSLKDKSQYENEHEVRLLCGDIYDDKSGPLEGRIKAGRKEALGYPGTYYSYSKCGLILKKIIIGYETSIKLVEEIQNMGLGVEIEIEKKP